MPDRGIREDCSNGVKTTGGLLDAARMGSGDRAGGLNMRALDRDQKCLPVRTGENGFTPFNIKTVMKSYRGGWLLTGPDCAVVRWLKKNSRSQKQPNEPPHPLIRRLRLRYPGSRFLVLDRFAEQNSEQCLR